MTPFHIHLHLLLLLFYAYYLLGANAFSGDQEEVEAEAEYLKLGPALSRPVAVLIVVLVSIFFIMVFLSVYLRHYLELHASTRATVTADGVNRFGALPMCGLDPAVIRTFPVVVYHSDSAVKDHMECAVCLAEFQHHETLRLIPKCGHVFHPHCIDAWLGFCATCPLCRAELVSGSDSPDKSTAASEFDDHRGVVIINVDEPDYSREQRLDRDGNYEAGN
ncbi:E3 ubiquitin-protein ligase ATL6-like [Momordica charantia]|uniref:RING-type E3 ubiquitin transferase n=1 Tax=Momordica charantia TaxID=3673 RepID=A0A6J1BTV2_MOMCH|nr:E3 ubiquitin-protein ligase ATL6-like [Momordica charantia]